MFRVVRGAFAQRRKTLENALSAAFSQEFSKDMIRDVMERCGFPPGVRGEKLSLEDFLLLSREMGRAREAAKDGEEEDR